MKKELMRFLGLLSNPWIPVITRAGHRRIIRPADLTAAIDADPVVDITWPRADFRAAQLEFLIGLLSTTCAPAGGRDWQRWWDSPPAPEELAERFQPFDGAFIFDGPGPRFLQDAGDLGAEKVPIAGLMIEQPGANTEKNNTDLFVKRGRIAVLARSTAAIALYSMQAFAPSGGAGHRTSLRGGGPLTTLALAAGKPSLWHLAWLNVADRMTDADDATPAEARHYDVFPWLAPTRVSDKSGRLTALADIHPAQCFWGMPRRIRLAFEPNPEGRACDVTGAVEDVVIRGYATRPWGVNYRGVPHLLTPTYRLKPGDTEWLSVHPQPGGIAYRHWVGFVQQSETRRPAGCVALAERRLATIGLGAAEDARLRVFGFDMDNMKARSFVEAERPLLFASDAVLSRDEQRRQPLLDTLVGRLVEGAVETRGIAIGAIKQALGGTGGASLDIAREAFFAGTEAAFFAAVRSGLDAIEAAPDEDGLLQRLAFGWLATLRTTARTLFDREVPVNALVDAADLAAIERAAAARRMLEVALAGYGAAGKRLYTALGMAPPGAKPPADKEAKAGRPRRNGIGGETTGVDA